MRNLIEKQKVNYHRTNLLIMVNEDLKGKINETKINSMTYEEISEKNQLNTIVKLGDEVFTRGKMVKRYSSFLKEGVLVLNSLDSPAERMIHSKKTPNNELSISESVLNSTKCLSTINIDRNENPTKDLSYAAHQKLMKLCNLLKKNKIYNSKSKPRHSCEEIRIPINEITKFIQENNKNHFNLIPCEDEEVSQKEQKQEQEFSISLYKCK